MSQYYKYNFVSPEPQYATVKEELKSYFDTGAIDDLMWPTYTRKCMDKLGKGSYSIVPEILYINNYETRLPDNFYAVREAWLCTEIDARPYPSPVSFYSQAASQTTIQVSPLVTSQKCTNVDCTGCTECMPELIQAVYKTNGSIDRKFKKTYLLKPGNISVKSHCTLDGINFGASGPDSFDIRDNKFVVNFRKGTVYLLFYATEYDNDQNQLIPDNYRIKEYIEKFLKFKMFETLCNQVNDETFNQLLLKKKEAEQASDEAFIMAKEEVQKQTVYQKQRSIKRQKNSFRMYELPTGIVPWRRWNGN
jgi:hypothetical protein